MQGECEKCGREADTVTIENAEYSHHFCRGCVKEALDHIAMMPFKNKEVRQLEKQLRKYLKHKVN
ncbi:MAG: hypothetical protein M1308_09150 [Actinobacteria bacterium]|nr:hypothetical protein [Actinomycetota bacterium]